MVDNCGSEDIYEFESKIDGSILIINWLKIVFFDDVFLNMQGMNIGVADSFITHYEYKLLREYLEIEKTSFDTGV